MNEQELKEIEDRCNADALAYSMRCFLPYTNQVNGIVPKLITEIRRLQGRACGHSIRGKNLETCASCCRSHARALDKYYDSREYKESLK